MIQTIFEYLKLLAYPIFILVLLFISWGKGWLLLNHENLFKQKLFWMVIILPFVGFLLYGSFAWHHHKLLLSAEGYKVFYDISKVPLLILAASVPLASIVNNIHRTIQTEKQIKEAEKKNFNDMYYSHMKWHIDFFNAIKGKSLDVRNISLKEPFIEHPVSLYRYIYPDSSSLTGPDPMVSNQFKGEMIGAWEGIDNGIRNLKSALSKRDSYGWQCYGFDIVHSIYFMELNLERLCNSLSISGYRKAEVSYVYDVQNNVQNKQITIHYTHCLDLINALISIEFICIKIVEIINDGSEELEVFFKRGGLREDMEFLKDMSLQFLEPDRKNKATPVLDII